MNEKLPAPCERCRASGLFEGHECEECGGKGYRLIVNGNLGIGAQAVKTAKKTTEPFSASNHHASMTLIGGAFTECPHQVRFTADVRTSAKRVR